jgi:hypothetical protein
VLRKLKEHAGLAALIVAMMALFVSLTGIAGALPGKGRIDTNDLKKNVVKSKNVAPDSLTGADINEGTLKLPAPAPTGIKVVQRTANFGPVASGAAGNGVASCVGNEKAVGGGFAAQSGFGRLDGSQPELNAQGVPVGWHIFVGNDSPGSATFAVYVLCASP